MVSRGRFQNGSVKHGARWQALISKHRHGGLRCADAKEEMSMAMDQFSPVEVAHGRVAANAKTPLPASLERSTSPSVPSANFSHRRYLASGFASITLNIAMFHLLPF